MRKLLFVLHVWTILLPCVASAGIVPIGTITPLGTVNDDIGGIAFDGTPNPIVVDSQTWNLSRVSQQTAAVISSVIPVPKPNNFAAALAYDPTTLQFFAIGQNQNLFSIQSGTLASKEVGTLYSAEFNFNALAVDPSGNLWMVTNLNTVGSNPSPNKLWEINKTTGVATPQAIISLPISGSVTSLAIDGNDNFFIVAAPIYLGQNYFYQLNPTNGSTTSVSTAFADSTISSYGEMLSMAYDPLSGNIYGITDQPYDSPRTYTLVQVSVPEPASALAGLLLGCGFLRGGRRPQKKSISRG